MKGVMAGEEQIADVPRLVFPSQCTPKSLLQDLHVVAPVKAEERPGKRETDRCQCAEKSNQPIPD